MPSSVSAFDRDKLEKLAWRCIVFLTATLLLSFFGGAYLLRNPAIDQFWSVVLLGLAGSSVAALTSCLNRYANGYEDEAGNLHPAEKSEKNKERFSRRFSAWLLVRPILGAVVAPVFIWSLALFADEAADFQAGSTDPSATLGFTAFMAGLLAKSVLDVIKNLFKNVFRT